jgi:hypothetical protein
MESARTGRRDAALVFLAALALYGYTLAPGLQWGDSASLALQVHQSALHLRSAGDHPLYVLLGMAFSLLPGEVAYNLTQLSAVAGALAVALVLRIASRLAGARSAGFFAAAALAVSHAFWLHAVIAEVYTLNALFVVLLVWLLVAVLVLCMGQARPQSDSVQAKKFVVVDENGKERAAFGMASGGPELVMLDSSDRTALQMQVPKVPDKAAIYLRDPELRADLELAMTMNGAVVHLNDKSGNRVRLATNELNAPLAAVYDGEGKLLFKISAE